MDALSQALLKVFENETLSYVREHFPVECGAGRGSDRTIRAG